MKPITVKEVELWQEMADLTLAKCKEHCHALGSCCTEGDCGTTERYAASLGVILERVPGSKIPFLKDGQCIVSPHLRPYCSLHQCKIASMGFDVKDPEWTKKYFRLRRQLERLAAKREEGK